MRNGYYMPDLPPEYAPVIQDTSRQMKMADLLRQQSLDMPNGQMVSGHYVAPSITQYMAQMLKGYNANKMEEDALAKQQGAYDEWQGNKQAANQQLVEALRPQQVEQGVDYADAGGMPGVTQTVTQQPDVESALARYIATGYADPAMIQLAQGRQNRQYQLEDRNYADNREERIYSRNRQDNLTDKEADREFQRIMQKEQQGFQLTQQERQFVQQRSLQESSQNFQRNERIAGQSFQAGENAKSRAATASKATQPDWKYDAGSDTWVAPPDANNPNGRRLANQEKQGAQRSMEVVMRRFEGEVGPDGKIIPGTGVIDTTPQGGWMGIKGKAGGISSYQQKKQFDNLREQLSTELRTVFRIPGEGALSDKEQAQYGMQLPSTDYDPDINRQILADIRARVNARLGGQQQNIMQKNEQMPAKASKNVLDEADRILNGGK